MLKFLFQFEIKNIFQSDSYNQYATAKSIQRDIANINKIPTKNGESVYFA